jgi:hypothetical protein
MRTTRKAGQLIAISIAGAIMSVAAAPASSDTASDPLVRGRTLLISNCKKAKFKPVSVIIACGDAGLVANGLTWTTWNRKMALGSGTGTIKTCVPDCASGGTKSAAIELSVSKPKTCDDGRRVFSKLRYTWTDGAPVGPASSSVPIGCKLIGQQ